MQSNQTEEIGWQLTVTSKGEFPYAEAREFGGQLETEDSDDKPGSILMEAQNYHIFY